MEYIKRLTVLLAQGVPRKTTNIYSTVSTRMNND